MGPVDYLVLLLTIVLACELVMEIRRKRWLPAVVSLLILFLLIWIGRWIYISLWQSVFGAPPQQTP